MVWTKLKHDFLPDERKLHHACKVSTLCFHRSQFASRPKGLKCQFSRWPCAIAKRKTYVERENMTLALLGIMILACRARISNRGRYFEITEAGNSFAESRFPVFRETGRERDTSFPMYTYTHVYVYKYTYVYYVRLLWEQQLSNRRYIRVAGDRCIKSLSR